MESHVLPESTGWRERAEAARSQRKEWRSVRALLFRLGVKGDAAEDVAQEVMLAVHRTTSSLERRALVWGVAKHAAAYYLRARAKRPEEHLEVVEVLAFHAAPSAEDLAVSSEATVTLSHAINELKDAEPTLHEVLALHLEGLAMPTIAERLSIPYGTAEGRLRRARASLGEKLRRWAAEEANRSARACLRRGARR